MAVTFNKKCKIKSNIDIYRKVDHFILRIAKT